MPDFGHSDDGVPLDDMEGKTTDRQADRRHERSRQITADLDRAGIVRRDSDTVYLWVDLESSVGTTCWAANQREAMVKLDSQRVRRARGSGIDGAEDGRPRRLRAKK